MMLDGLACVFFFFLVLDSVCSMPEVLLTHAVNSWPRVVCFAVLLFSKPNYLLPTQPSPAPMPAAYPSSTAAYVSRS